MEENQKVGLFLGFIRLQDRHKPWLVYLVLLSCSMFVSYVALTGYMTLVDKQYDNLYKLYEERGLEIRSLKEENRRLYDEVNPILQKKYTTLKEKRRSV